MTDTLELTVTQIIPAPRKDVFEAWLDPAALAQFMKPGEEMGDARVEVDARQGGSFLIAMQAGDQELPHRGEYKTISKYDRLVFTWLSSYTIPDSTVTIDFKEVGPSQTELTLHHAGFPTEEARNNHEGGWARIAQLLSKVVS
jgi:uncharacterized protein YndB with AHSA1/START domain